MISENPRLESPRERIVLKPESPPRVVRAPYGYARQVAAEQADIIARQISNGKVGVVREPVVPAVRHPSVRLAASTTLVSDISDKQASMEVNLESAKAAFRACDKDGNGYLTWNNGEIRNYVTICFRQSGLTPPSEEQIYAIYTKLDKDHSYSLDVNECLGIMQELMREAYLGLGVPVYSKVSSVPSVEPPVQDLAPFTAEQLRILDSRQEALLESCRAMIRETAPDSFAEFFENMDEQVKLLFDQVSFLSTSCEQRFQNNESDVNAGFQSRDQNLKEHKAYCESRFQELINQGVIRDQSLKDHTTYCETTFQEMIDNMKKLSDTIVGQRDSLTSLGRSSPQVDQLAAKLAAMEARFEHALNDKISTTSFEVAVGKLQASDSLLETRYEELTRRILENESSFDAKYEDMINNLNLLSNSLEERLQGIEKPLDLLTQSIEERFRTIELQLAISKNDVSIAVEFDERLKDLQAGLQKEVEERESLGSSFATQMKDLRGVGQKVYDLTMSLESEVQERCRDSAQLTARCSIDFAELRKWVVQELGAVLAALQTSEASHGKLITSLKEDISLLSSGVNSIPEGIDKRQLEEVLRSVQALRVEFRKELEQFSSQEKKEFEKFCSREKKEFEKFSAHERQARKDTLEKMQKEERLIATLAEKLATESTTREKEIEKVYSLLGRKEDVTGCKKELDQLRQELRSALQEIVSKLRYLETHAGTPRPQSPLRTHRDASPTGESETVIGSVLWGWSHER